MKRIKDIAKLLKMTFDEWNEDGAPHLAAALAYYTAFSLAPLLVIIIGVFGILVSQDTLRAQILQEIQHSVGTDAADMVRGMIESINQPGQGVLSTIIGFVTLLLGAVGAFGNLQMALDIIWDVDRTKRPSGIKALARDRALSFGMLLLIGFLLLVSMVLSTVISAVSTFVVSRIVGLEFIFQGIAFVVSFGVITLLFAMIYKYLPHTHVKWRDVWTGAAVTSALFTIGKTLLALYLAHSSPASAYGAAGAFVLILLWIYYSAQIILFGAEFTQVYARRYTPAVEAGLEPLQPAAAIVPDATKNAFGETKATTLAPEGAAPEEPETSEKKGMLFPAVIFSAFWLMLGFITNKLQSRDKVSEGSQE